MGILPSLSRLISKPKAASAAPAAAPDSIGSGLADPLASSPTGTIAAQDAGQTLSNAVGPHKPGAWSRFKTRMKKGADFGQNEVAPRAAGFAPQAGNAAGVGSLAATLGTAQHSGVHLDASQIPAVGGKMMGNLADTGAELGTSITAGALSGGVGVLKAGLGAKGFVGGARNMHAASSMGGKLLAGKEMVDGAFNVGHALGGTAGAVTQTVLGATGVAPGFDVVTSSVDAVKNMKDLAESGLNVGRLGLGTGSADALKADVEAKHHGNMSKTADKSAWNPLNWGAKLEDRLARGDKSAGIHDEHAQLKRRAASGDKQASAELAQEKWQKYGQAKDITDGRNWMLSHEGQKAAKAGMNLAGNAMDIAGTFTAAGDGGATKIAGKTVKGAVMGGDLLKAAAVRAKRVETLRRTKNATNDKGRNDRGLLWGAKEFLFGNVRKSQRNTADRVEGTEFATPEMKQKHLDHVTPKHIRVGNRLTSLAQGGDGVDEPTMRAAQDTLSAGGVNLGIAGKLATIGKSSAEKDDFYQRNLYGAEDTRATGKKGQKYNVSRMMFNKIYGDGHDVEDGAEVRKPAA